MPGVTYHKVTLEVFSGDVAKSGERDAAGRTMCRFRADVAICIGTFDDKDLQRRSPAMALLVGSFSRREFASAAVF
jgi:hypothetical protein